MTDTLKHLIAQARQAADIKLVEELAVWVRSNGLTGVQASTIAEWVKE
ncbi:hypothetical protein [Marinobacter sp.]|nr:hypothetical protein [Marinobacter sp.]|tara:strand:+ start:4224 stop:4367 length:144 start_codon:yes stop_codon:yes gene_type:complete